MAEDLRILEPAGFGLATIMARREVDAARIGAALGVDAPSGSRWAAADGLTLMGTGPGAWLARRDAAPPFWVDELRERLAGLASVSDQSSAYALWHLSGWNARRLLERGASIDFHPESFSSGTVATTVIAHIGVIIRQLDDAPTYELATFRSYAASFTRWLESTAAAI